MWQQGERVKMVEWEERRMGSRWFSRRGRQLVLMVLFLQEKGMVVGEVMWWARGAIAMKGRKELLLGLALKAWGCCFHPL
jgi:hypothetical protein